MDRETRRVLDEFRRNEATPIENNLIDELVDGELDRGEFLRRGAMFGLSAGILSSALAFAGEAAATPQGSFAATARNVKVGGTARVGLAKWGGSLEPYKLAEAGSLGMSGIPGEYLTYSDNSNRIQPWLAQSWKANKTATVWTFQLRRGVRFHNGAEMTADDVVANYKLYTGNKQSQALSIFEGILGPEGVTKGGRYTVVFRLKQPTGAFPYLVSQTSYQCIIYPRSIKPDAWVKSGMIGTGPFKLRNFTEKREYNLVRHETYWGGRPPLDGVKVTAYETSTAMALALRAGQLDIVSAVSRLEAQPMIGNSKFRILTLPTAAHRQFTMRADDPALKDPRVRRAVALTINRPQVISGLLRGAATIGNDTPFWARYPSSAPTPQRRRNIAQAKQLLSAAGAEGVSFTITTHRLQELPDYAAAIQRYGRDAGMDIKIELQSDAEYYGGGDDYYATTPWINKPSTITEWGHRAVPNVYLTAAYLSNGIWNAAHYKNASLDRAIKSYLSAVDLASQRKYSKQVSTIIQRDVPVVTAYHFTSVTPVAAKVRNFQLESINHVRLAKTWLA
jgi:peptide/nickel transport system substrate-binding protein